MGYVPVFEKSIMCLKQRPNIGRTAFAIGAASSYYFYSVAYSQPLFIGTAALSAVCLSQVFSEEVKQNINVADIMLLPTNTDVRLTFMSGKTFIVPISSVKIEKDFGIGNMLKFVCSL